MRRTYSLKVCPFCATRYFSDDRLCSTDESNSISKLSDDVLLEIFDLYRKDHYNNPRPLPVWKWHILVHVCQRWRQLVFSSPSRLNLHIHCTYGTAVRKDLCIWPAFPIVLDLYIAIHLTPDDEDNAIAALENSDRVHSVMLYLTGPQLANMAMVMSKPFPLLTSLKIHSIVGNDPVLPGEFLGGPAPRLQELYLHSIPFLALPTLLLSANNLITLVLSMIPRTGYIPPEAMVVCLSALPRLKTFLIDFQSKTLHPDPDGSCPPHATRNVLPALSSFTFRGVSEYLEDLVAQIDAPELERISVVYWNQPHNVRPTHLSDFINRSVGPELTPSRRAHVIFHLGRVAFTLYRRANYSGCDQRRVEVSVSMEKANGHTPDLTQVLGDFFAILRTVIHLELELHLDDNYQLSIILWHNLDWPYLFRQFPAMQILDVSGCLARYMAAA